MDKELNFKVALEDIRNIMNNAKQKFFLCCGTLLGCYRENKFIEHDNDIDLGILYNDFKPSIKEKIIESGKFILSKELGNISTSYEMTFTHTNGTNIDIFIFYKIKKDFYYCASFYGICDSKPEGFCKWGYIIRGFKIKKFYGKSYYIPSNVKEHLCGAYGEDFMTPKIFSYNEGLNGGYKGLLN